MRDLAMAKAEAFRTKVVNHTTLALICEMALPYSMRPT